MKDNWDDEESDKEEDEGTGSVSELATPDTTTPSLPDIKGGSAHEPVEDGQEEESGSDTDSGESSSEEDEDEEVSPYDRAARRIQVVKFWSTCPNSHWLIATPCYYMYM